MPKLYPELFNRINWNVGSLIAHDRFVIDLTKLCLNIGAPKPISSVFGSVPCKWQGGRLAPRDASLLTIKELVLKYNQLGISCRFTFSRYYISIDDLNDELCNDILSILHEYNHCNDEVHNGVIVSSELLANYIKSKYPDLEIVISIVKSTNELKKCNDKLNYYNELTSKYNLVVMDSDLVFDLDFMSKLENKSNIEILANHRCTRNCQLASRHYEIQTIIEQKTLLGEDCNIELSELERINEICFRNRIKNPTNSSIIDMYTIKILADIGYSNFKLEGRDYNSTTFIRDIGNWIFNPQGGYLALAQSLVGEPI